jgi:predicted nucleic acid-binding protein
LISFDANVLVYAADRLAGERHRRAADLLERSMRLQNCSQPLQSFAEFFNVVTRKAGVDALAAAAIIEVWGEAMTVEAAVMEDLHTAIRAVREHRLSFWDAMLWATIRRIGVRLLITEDLQDGRVLEGVRFVNPFAAHNDALIDQEIPR